MRLQKIVVAVAVFCLVGACAGRPSSLLVATGDIATEADTVNILTISTREETDEPGVIYSGERSETSSTKIVTVAIPPDHEPGKIEWPETGDPAWEFSTVNILEPSFGEVRQWFRDQDADGHVLIFTHGYNTRYGEAVYRLAQLTYDLNINAAPVLFTWPSRGTFGSYLYDKESASIARDKLEQIIRIAAATDETKSITLLAHSMGGWVTMEALRQYAIRHGALDKKISSIILASPDIDVDLFETQIEALGRERPNVTILLSTDDKALSLSRILAGGVSRIGAVDVSDDVYAAKMADISGIKLVDLSELDVDGSLHHSKFADEETAIDFLGSEIVDQARSSGLTAQTQAVLIGLSEAMENAATEPMLLQRVLD